ncbi:MAG: cation-transporting P-type ATPase, partial [Bacilli bacterium]|nr:cation-transporting P-type ATPase [Bacilli bacterium]
MKNESWHSQSKEYVLNTLYTSMHGLSEQEAKSRLKENGKNILPKAKRDGIFTIFFRQFINPIVIILIIAIILSFSIGETLDAIFIFVVIIMDAIFGTTQEWKAEKSAESLRNMIRVNANVIRNNKEKTINSENLVIGDIVHLDSGDKISADMRLMSTHNLSVDESSLTGESM